MPLKIGKKRVTTSKFRKKLGADAQALMPQVVDVPDKPIYERGNKGGGDTALHEEQQVARVELMMLKGIRNRRQLMTLLEIEDQRQMERYIKRVNARWELGGTTKDFARHRGEGLSRLDLIESEMWSRLSQLDQKSSPQIALNYLNSIQNVQRQRSEILGLSPKVIAHIGTMDDGTSDFAKKLTEYDRMAMLAGMMARKMEERTRVIEHDDEDER